MACCLTRLSNGRRYWQQQVSQFERIPPPNGKSGRGNDWRPIPHEPRELGSSGVFDPSVHDELEELLSITDDQMQELLENLFGPVKRGAYRPRRDK